MVPITDVVCELCLHSLPTLPCLPPCPIPWSGTVVRSVVLANSAALPPPFAQVMVVPIANKLYELCMRSLLTLHCTRLVQPLGRSWLGSSMKMHARYTCSTGL